MIRPFATKTNVERSSQWHNERLINMYAHFSDSDSKSSVVLYRTPGLTLFADVGPDLPIRGQIAAIPSDYMIVVAGSQVRKVLKDGTSTVVGSVNRGANNPVSMATNGDQIAICSGGFGYICNGATTVLISTKPWASVSYVTYQDGYFIWTEADTGKFYISGLYDGLDINALDFASAEGSPDKLIACLSNGRDLFLLGTDSVEIWRNTGNADFPFEEVSGAAIPLGTRSPYAIADGDGIFMIGESKKFGPRVYYIDGYSPRSISTSHIDRLLESCTKINEAIGWFYSQEGHSFYVLQIPDQGTFVYDASTDRWDERNSGYAGTSMVAWRAYSHVWQWNKHIVGDWATGKLYTMSLDKLMDDGKEVIWEAWSANTANGDNAALMDRIFIDLDTGVGESSGIGYDPFVGLEFSDDGGKTWSNKRLASIGKQGMYGARAIWWRCGRFRQRQFRLTGNYPVRTAIIGTTAITEVTGL